MKRLLVVIAALAVSCEPKSSNDDWLVTTARVIAVKGEPAETKPGESATYTAFVADPTGKAQDPVRFAWCLAPKPPEENGVVSPSCLETSSSTPLGEADAVTATTPGNACTLFGPIAAPGGFRPRDPDGTGGYYQPLEAELRGSDPVFHLSRISCGVANASADVAAQFAATYHANVNPKIDAIAASTGNHAVELTSVPPGVEVELVLRWTSADAETYVEADPETSELHAAREAMQIAWYVTAGALRTESTSRGATDPSLETSNVWTAPKSPGTTRLWAVLRDSRGGVDVAERDLVVSGD